MTFEVIYDECVQIFHQIRVSTPDAGLPVIS